MIRAIKCFLGRHPKMALHWTPALGGIEKQTCALCGRVVNTRNVSMQAVQRGVWAKQYARKYSG